MKIGIYGGTFNPPHLGHLAAARTALDALKLDKLEGLYTDEIEDLLVQVTDERLFVVAEALRRGFSPKRSTTSPRWTSGSWTASSGSSPWRTS